MDTLSIGELAGQAGMAPSAIRYYESIGLLPEPRRVSGRRRYDAAAPARLALIGRAREAGFTLAEIGELLEGFPPGTKPAQRWNAFAARKLAEIEDRIARAEAMREMLRHLMTCECPDMETCATRIAAAGACAP
jgi:MerR family redox-sensitive transcriptional activator SoxR